MSGVEITGLYVLVSLGLAGLTAYVGGRRRWGDDTLPLTAMALVAWPALVPVLALAAATCWLRGLGELHANRAENTQKPT